jgi:hypothetical protein
MTTPMSPGEALARFSPIKPCSGVVPIRVPKRHGKPHWRHDHGNWWVEDGPATLVTRSVSADTLMSGKSSQSAQEVPKDRIIGPLYEHHLPRDRVTGWRPKVMTRVGYTAEQVAGFQLYEMKSKRLSSQEYATKNAASSNSSAESAAFHLDTLADIPPDSPPRVVELEANTSSVSPLTRSPSKCEQKSPVSLGRNQSSLRCPSDIFTPPKRIPRKPVGSSTGVDAMRTISDPLLIWPLEKSRSRERPSRSQSPRKRKMNQGYEYASSIDMSPIFSPWDTHEPPSSPTTQSREARTRSTGRKHRLPVRFYNVVASEPAIELDNCQSSLGLKYGERLGYTLYQHFFVVYNFANNIRSSNNDAMTLHALFGLEDRLTLTTAKEWGIWTSKLLFGLYLAACLWTVLAAVRDALVVALEPVFALLGFVKWVIG